MLKKAPQTSESKFAGLTNDQLAKAIGRKLHETAKQALQDAQDRLQMITDSGQSTDTFGGNVHDVMVKGLAHCLELGGDGNWGQDDSTPVRNDDDQDVGATLAAILGGDGGPAIGDDVDADDAYAALFGDDEDQGD